MKTNLLFIGLSTIIALLVGCVSKEGVYENIYNELKTRETIVRPSAEQKPTDKSPSYEDYSVERKRLLKNKDR
jgi:hypothetical protein